MEAAAAYIQRQFSEIGDAVLRQTYSIGDGEVSNLVVERKGSRSPGKIVVVGAHYDTVPITPGADDNASAVAMMIEVARLVAPDRPRRTLRFVAFACEEPPYFHTDRMGSRQYALACRERVDRVVGMICLEMVGFYSSAPDSQQVPPAIPRLLQRVFPRRGDFLASVANLRSLGLLLGFRRGFKRESSLPLFSVALPERLKEITLSDNSSFWDQGYPALMITDTSFLRNPNYHWQSDTPETLNYESMAEATKGVAGAVRLLSRSKPGTSAALVSRMILEPYSRHRLRPDSLSRRPSPAPSARSALSLRPAVSPSRRSRSCCRRPGPGWRDRGYRPGRGRSRCRAAGSQLLKRWNSTSCSSCTFTCSSTTTMNFVNAICPAPQIACITRRAWNGYSLWILMNAQLWNTPTDRQGVIDDVGDEHLQQRQEDPLGRLAEEIVLHRRLADDRRRVDRVLAVRDRGDVEGGIPVGQRVEAGVIAEGAFHQLLVRIDVAFDDDLGVGGDFAGRSCWHLHQLDAARR